MKEGLWGLFRHQVKRIIVDSFKISKNVEAKYGVPRDYHTVTYNIEFSVVRCASKGFDLLLRFLQIKIAKAVKEKV